jgi:hypothetical protein
MTLILVLLIAVIAIVIGSKLRVPGGAKAKTLGAMSPQWLAENRKSPPPS